MALAAWLARDDRDSYPGVGAMGACLRGFVEFDCGEPHPESTSPSVVVWPDRREGRAFIGGEVSECSGRPGYCYLPGNVLTVQVHLPGHDMWTVDGRLQEHSIVDTGEIALRTGCRSPRSTRAAISAASQRLRPLLRPARNAESPK